MLRIPRLRNKKQYHISKLQEGKSEIDNITDLVKRHTYDTNWNSGLNGIKKIKEHSMESDKDAAAGAAVIAAMGCFSTLGAALASGTAAGITAGITSGGVLAAYLAYSTYYHQVGKRQSFIKTMRRLEKDEPSTKLAIELVQEILDDPTNVYKLSHFNATKLGRAIVNIAQALDSSIAKVHGKKYQGEYEIFDAKIKSQLKYRVLDILNDSTDLSKIDEGHISIQGIGQRSGNTRLPGKKDIFRKKKLMERFEDVITTKNLVANDYANTIKNGAEDDIKELFKNPRYKTELLNKHAKMIEKLSKTKKISENKTAYDVMIEALEELCEQKGTTINNEIQNAFLMGLHRKNENNDCHLFNALGTTKNSDQQDAPSDPMGDLNLVNLILEYTGKSIEHDKVIVKSKEGTLNEGQLELLSKAPNFNLPVLNPEDKKKNGWASKVDPKDISFGELFSVRGSVIRREDKKPSDELQISNIENIKAPSVASDHSI